MKGLKEAAVFPKVFIVNFKPDIGDAVLAKAKSTESKLFRGIAPYPIFFNVLHSGTPAHEKGRWARFVKTTILTSYPGTDLKDKHGRVHI